MSVLTDILAWLGLLAQIAPAPEPLYGGLDNSSFPGEAFMRLLRPVAPAAPNTNLSWTGLYLSHSFGGSDTTWTTRTAWLQADGWGILPTYFGHQVHPAPAPPPPAPQPPPIHPLATDGTADAALALTGAAAATLPIGCVIYLDWEWNDVPNAADVGYMVNWCTAIAAAGYRPGLYAFRNVALRMRQEVPGLFMWVINVIGTGGGISPPDPANPTFVRWNLRGPSATDDPDAIARQYLQPWVAAQHTIPNPTPPPARLPAPGVGIHAWPAGFTFTMPGLAGVHYGTVVNPHPPPQFNQAAVAFDAAGHPQFDIDLSGSTVGDPLFPERHVRPSLVRGGTFVAAALDAATLAMFGVRRGALVAVTWVDANPTVGTAVALPAHALTCNPWSRPSALQRTTSGDVAFVARSSAAGTADNAWQLHAYRRRGTNWTFDSNINGTTVIEPVLGVQLVSRVPNTVEAFFVTNDGTNRVFVVSCADAATQVDGQTWAAPVEVNAPAGGMQPSLTGGIAAVSSAAGVVDVFVVARSAPASPWQLFWNSSSVLGTWPHFGVPGDTTLTLHPFSNVVAVSRGPSLINVFAIAKGAADTHWMLYTWWWNSATSWGTSPNFNSMSIGALINPHPTSKVAAVSRTAQYIDVFVVGAIDGLLYNAYFDATANTWSDFRRVGTNAIKVASVDSAVSRTPTGVDVIVTGRDGKVYESSWNTSLAGYSDLRAVTAYALA